MSENKKITAVVTEMMKKLYETELTTKERFDAAVAVVASISSSFESPKISAEEVADILAQGAKIN